jgi:hypothetical protein
LVTWRKQWSFGEKNCHFGEKNGLHTLSGVEIINRQHFYHLATVGTARKEKAISFGGGKGTFGHTRLILQEFQSVVETCAFIGNQHP